MSRRSAYCCIYHNTSNGDKIVMKCVAFFMLILYIFSHEIYGDNGRIYQITGARNQISHMPLTTHGASFVYNITRLETRHLGLVASESTPLTSSTACVRHML